jgi:hypothetical protein
MNLIYPRTWGSVGSDPEFVLHTPRPAQSYHVEISQIIDGTHIKINMQQPIWLSSLHGFVKLVKTPQALQSGAYIITFFEKRFNRIILQGGFVVNDGITLPSLTSCLDTIEALNGNGTKAKYLANGIGKSGTTWLAKLLGSLPGCHNVDMTTCGLTGVDHRELSQIALGGVYQGHLPYGFETVEALSTLNYHNVHICRDLRDVIVSEYFHKFVMAADQFVHLNALNLSKDDLLTENQIYSWSSSIYQAKSVLEWTAERDCVLVRYEDLLTHPIDEFLKICRALRLPIDAALTTYIVETNEFSIVTQGRKPGTADPHSPLRNGLAGDWRNHLSDKTAQWLVNRHLAYYQALNYPID